MEMIDTRRGYKHVNCKDTILIFDFTHGYSPSNIVFADIMHTKANCSFTSEQRPSGAIGNGLLISGEVEVS